MTRSEFGELLTSCLFFCKAVIETTKDYFTLTNFDFDILICGMSSVKSMYKFKYCSIKLQASTIYVLVCITQMRFAINALKFVLFLHNIAKYLCINKNFKICK